jgi:hypothetical protein
MRKKMIAAAVTEVAHTAGAKPNAVLIMMNTIGGIAASIIEFRPEKTSLNSVKSSFMLAI